MKIEIVNISDSFFIKKKEEETIYFFSDEWTFRQKQCLNLANSKNGIYDRRIYARNCQTRVLNKNEAQSFFDTNHIQGCNNLGLFFLGLFLKEELVGAISLGRHNRNIDDNRIVLDRLCFKYGVHVLGGASKLFKGCIKWAKHHNYEEIVSFSDNRLTSGNVYKVLGFSLEKEHKPDYSYVDTKNPIKRLSKQSQKKSTSKCPKNATELEWATQRGLRRIWDLGKKRWVYYLDPSKKTWKEKLSDKCAKQHAAGKFKHSHIRGYFKSIKCNKEIYYSSSYELRCLYLLEKNDNISFFDRADVFQDKDKRWRNPDLFVIYKDKSKEIIEVKPKDRLNEPEIIKQINATKTYTDDNNVKFKIWTEEDSLLEKESNIINWAKKYIAETTGNIDWIEKQKSNSRQRAKKHYHEKIRTNQVKVFCNYCNEEHSVLRKSYEANIQRNGRYICEREGGHIAGKTPKKKKENPYAIDGKKQCNCCKEIKLFEDFSPDKSKTDGYSTRCKICRARIYKEKYQNQKAKINQ